jgi:hypothetical protein
MHVHPATVFAGLLAAATAVDGSIDHNNSAVHKALYALHSSSTPVWQIPSPVSFKRHPKMQPLVHPVFLVSWVLVAVR